MANEAHGTRIDVHHHFYAPEYLAAMGDNAKRPEIRDWTLARTIEEMDKNGVATAMLSLSPPGFHHAPTAEVRKTARAINESRFVSPKPLHQFASVAGLFDSPPARGEVHCAGAPALGGS